MNELTVFNNEMFGEIRTIPKGGETWFVLADICNALGLTNASIVAARLDDDERSKSDLGRQGNGIIINESGLYSVILRSDKPNAKKFKKWITSEVLPQIRATGGYIPMTSEDTEQDIMAKALIIANNTITRKNERLTALQAELDNSRQWYTIKRVALLNGVSWKRLDWKELKRVSSILGYEVKKIFDANYGTVNSYHQDVWSYVYPDFKL